MPFVKLDTAILESTLWVDRAARDIFITALLMAEPREVTKPMPQYFVDRIEQTGFSVPPGWYGFVAAAGVGIARRAFVDQDEGMRALETLGSTDPHSRSPEFGGRRLVRVDGGFIVLNFFKYRDKDYTAAERMAKLRARRKAQGVTANSDAVTRNSDAADADANADAKEQNLSAHPSDEREKDSPAVASDTRPSRAQLAVLAAEVYAAYPRKVAKAPALKAIQKAIVTIADRDFRGNLKAAAEWLKSRVDHYAQSPQGRREDKTCIPHPATWFNDGRYDDDPSQWAHVGQAKSAMDKYHLTVEPGMPFKSVSELTREARGNLSVNVKDQAERTLLGAILLDNRLIYECAELRAEWFGLDAHRQIFSAMQRLDAAGKQIDTITLASELADKFESVGGYEALNDLLNGSMERPNLSSWVDIIRDAAKRRHLAIVCQDLLNQLDEPATNTDELLDQAESHILTLRASGTAGRVSHVKTVVPTVLNELCAQMKHKNELVGLRVGIDTIDYATTGIRPGEYCVVGGAPSRGKTILGNQIGVTSARAGVPVLIFSYEMTKEQLVKRMVPIVSGVPAAKVRDFRNGGAADYEAIQKATNEILTWPMWVCDPDGMSAEEMCAIAKLHIRRHGVRLVVVDYLQIVNAEGKDLRAKVGYASNALRSLAKTERIGVVALSQLRRPVNEADHPTMFALKESGDIEAHAHTILLLHRPKDDQGQWSGTDEVIIAKQREGLVGTELVLLDSRMLWFVPRAEREGR